MMILSIIKHIFPQLILIILYLNIGIALYRYFDNNKQRLSVMVVFLLLAGGWITMFHTSDADATELSRNGTPKQEILILNSYHPGYAWSDDQQAGIIDVIREKEKNWVPVIEYLDLRRLSDGKHLAELKKLFYLKYQDKKFSVIIAMDNPALDFAIDNQAELFRNAPVVFCGINNFKPDLLKGHTNVTGIVEAIDPAGTIEVMLRLHPAIREIFSPQDYTATGLAVRKELEALVPRFGKIRFRFTDPLTMEELLKELEQLPKDSLVLEIGFNTDKSGRTFDVSETTQLFSEHSPVPIYSTYEQRLGFGIVGGKLLSARIHGVNAGRIAMRVLAGEKASGIPIVFQSDARFMFDYSVMNRFGIPLSALPGDSTVINKPVSFYATHRTVIHVALGVVFFLIIIIILLTITIVQRKRSLEAIRRSEELLKVITTSNPDHILVQDSELRYSFVMNPQLGLTLQDMIGKTDYDFLSREEAEQLAAIKRQVLETGNPVHVEVPLIPPNGEPQFFNGSYIPKYDAKGQIDGLIGYFRNVTDRKKAEEKLHASLQEKRILLREIHHRVKNNLQFISSLLELQATASGNPEVSQIIYECQNRITSMSMIHEKLYEAKDFARVDFAGYVSSLSQELSQFYKVHEHKINLEIQIDDEVSLDINKAIPCGLILNELISNAFRHAFPTNRPGEIKVVIRETEKKEMEIIVSDNGVGLPEDIDPNKTQSVGLYLVNGLLKNQLGGQMDINREGGTELRIRFPL